MCNTARRNLRLRFFDYVRGKSETKDGRFVDFMLTHRHGYSKLTDITVDGVDADLIYGACLEGAQGAPLESITLKNLKLTLGSPNHEARAAKEKPFLFNCGSEIASGLGGVRVANLTVPQWSDEWAGLSSARPAQDVPPTGIAFAVCEDSTKSVVTEQPPLVLQSHASDDGPDQACKPDLLLKDDLLPALLLRGRLLLQVLVSMLISRGGALP